MHIRTLLNSVFNEPSRLKSEYNKTNQKFDENFEQDSSLLHSIFISKGPNLAGFVNNTDNNSINNVNNK